jgi:hypothetical protein
MNWVAELLGGNKNAALPAYEPDEWLKQNEIESVKAIETYCELLLQGEMAAETVRLAGKLAGASPPKLAPALQVLLQAPEYQLA